MRFTDEILKSGHPFGTGMHFDGIFRFYGDSHSGELRLIVPTPETFGKDFLHPEPAE